MVQVWCRCDEMYVGRMADEQPYVHDDRSRGNHVTWTYIIYTITQTCHQGGTTAKSIQISVASGISNTVNAHKTTLILPNTPTSHIPQNHRRRYLTISLTLQGLCSRATDRINPPPIPSFHHARSANQKSSARHSVSHVTALSTFPLVNRNESWQPNTGICSQPCMAWNFPRSSRNRMISTNVRRGDSQ
ncbi:hypothetical protein EJ04DRAFT_171858 [Polyplosphaeria fusca]|uniref:Uncharacterized protein n=1 Tax=Polyplosphaeria fusca TaxID=682080 RepID=A0A9P4QL47_9PLEO|nr:hypothetical protein EJ04DRAFT_171858 [Polyplosphaeria fusca]